MKTTDKPTISTATYRGQENHGVINVRNIDKERFRFLLHQIDQLLKEEGKKTNG